MKPWPLNPSHGRSSKYGNRSRLGEGGKPAWDVGLGQEVPLMTGPMHTHTSTCRQVCPEVHHGGVRHLQEACTPARQMEDRYL